MPVFNSRNDGLARYINSLGLELPLNWRVFKKGADNEDSCPFCGNPHNKLPVYRYRPSPIERELVEGLYCCITCNNDIDNMVDVEYSNAIFENEDDTPASDMQNHRVTLFNNLGKFDQSAVFKYYQHLDEAIDRYASGFTARCYWCINIQDHTIPNDAYQLMPVPVNAGQKELSGGSIRCCHSCYSRLSVKNHDYVTTLCASCEQPYTIEISEHESRKVIGTVGKYDCPSCAYKRILKARDAIYAAHQHVREVSPEPRYKHLGCVKCGTEITFDLMINEKYYRKNVIKGKVYCNVCAVNNPNDNGMVKTFLVGKDIVVKLHKKGNYWVYDICRISPIGEQIVLKTPPQELNRTDEIIVTLEAYDVALGVMGGTQLKFEWEQA